MGLDMYLKASRYLSNYSFSNEKDRKDYASLLELAGLKGVDTSNHPSAEISFTIAYWRKANAIHNWFVQNCADGKDDCKPVCVTRENLEALLGLCKSVLANPESANDNLPTKDGFFFGSTNYNEHYRRDIENTVTMLESVLNNPAFDRWGFEYRASW